MQLTTSFVLANDLTCPGDAFVIHADGDMRTLRR